jgi:Aspartyl protease
MVYSQEYDRLNYDPAAPVVEITITNSNISELRVNLVAMIDSGADATMLPIDVLKTIEAKFIETRQMRGITGHSIKVDTYLLTMRIGPFSIFGIEAIALEQNSEAIIGRDTLNQLQVILDGLSNTVTISQ